MSIFRLSVQCQKCPWKIGTDPTDIPHHYDPDKHRALERTDGRYATIGHMLHLMACHNSEPGDEYVCVGWLRNQLDHNNIPLRLRVLGDKEAIVGETVGPQHPTIQAMCDTAP